MRTRVVVVQHGSFPVISITNVNAFIKLKSKEYMLEATEMSILKGLQNIKKSHYYLNKDISLNSVATELNINQRYLSYVINKHKSKDLQVI